MIPISIEPAIDPNNRISFLLDWEITLKCNLDCSYCGTGLYGGHDNSIPHPPVEECKKTVDFMFSYVDLYMKHRPRGLRYVVLNVYGGESLHHPEIVDILKHVRESYEPYRSRWHLTVTTTTNGIIKTSRMQSILERIDEFTMSYHTENTPKQKQLFLSNLYLLKNANKRVKCVVLMHNKTHLFDDAVDMIAWLKEHDFNYLARQLDEAESDPTAEIEKKTYNRVYSTAQIKWFDGYYKNKTHRADFDTFSDLKSAALSSVGRACCGGRQLCTDGNHRQRHFYIDNRFTGWFCSVNRFFLYVKQVNGEVFVNKDCKMNFQGQVGAIGNLRDTSAILQDLSRSLETGQLPVVQCAKERCMCGVCAPKAKNFDTYNQIMRKYIS